MNGIERSLCGIIDEIDCSDESMDIQRESSFSVYQGYLADFESKMTES